MNIKALKTELKELRALHQQASLPDLSKDLPPYITKDLLQKHKIDNMDDLVSVYTILSQKEKSSLSTYGRDYPERFEDKFIQLENLKKASTLLYHKKQKAKTAKAAEKFSKEQEERDKQKREREASQLRKRKRVEEKYSDPENGKKLLLEDINRVAALAIKKWTLKDIVRHAEELDGLGDVKHSFDARSVVSQLFKRDL